MTESQQSAAIAHMQERQESWTRVARSSSSTSASSSPASSPISGFTPAVGYGGVSEKKKGKDGGGGGKSKPRKKVAKACLACQKSHLTCDEQRPCTRCVKKGIGDQCVEGVRKKAKYLLEGDERTLQQQNQQPPPSNHSLSPSVPPQMSASIPPMTLPSDPLPTPPTASTSSTQPHVPDDIWLAAPMENDTIDTRQIWGDQQQITDGLPSGTTYPFGITAAADEFQMLDAMFGSMSPVFPFDTTPTQNVNNMQQDAFIPAAPIQPKVEPQDSLLQQWSQEYLGSQANNSANSAANNFDLHSAWAALTANQPALNQPPIGNIPNDAMQLNTGLTNQQSNIVPTNSSSISTTSPFDSMINSHNSHEAKPIGEGPFSLQNGQGFRPNRTTPSEVYRTVTKPYDYTEGYHVLMQYLSQNFEQKDVLRVVHSLAAFRPSLIALQMPMSEEDEVFIERSFQRTLIELEKLISYSATPTAVWRRTGEICYVNPEFCRLVSKTEADLYSGKSYIYQLFAKSSVLAYWENFSVHAFENTTQNFFQPTALNVQSQPGDAVQCSACFTIRRDVFDLPSVIIGQFLPIPKDM